MIKAIRMATTATGAACMQLRMVAGMSSKRLTSLRNEQVPQ